MKTSQFTAGFLLLNLHGQKVFWVMSGKSYNILQLILLATDIKASYNEYTIAFAHRNKFTVISFQEPQIEPTSEITMYSASGSFFAFFKKIRELLRQQHFDVIHTHSPHVGFLFVIVNFLMFFGKYRSRSVHTVHSSYHNYKLRNKLLLVPVFAFFGRVVCCSLSSYESFPYFYRKLAGNRFTHISNGVDIKRIQNVEEKLAPESNFEILVVGRIVEVKNPQQVLEAVFKSNLQDFKLTYLGDGDLADSIRARARELGLQDRVEITGLVPRECVFQLMQRADLFVSTSRIEGLPIAVMEAMANRCPVLLSDIPPHRELADLVDFIPVVAVEDLQGFADGIRKFASLSAGERQEIGEKCLELVAREFNLTKTHDRYQNLYGELAG